MNDQSSKKRRNISGLLLLDKPIGLTSNNALQRVKHIYMAQKAGHTGSLDPLATGLLPICFGQATKFSGLLLDIDKRYRVRLRLGITTTTGDREGEVISEGPTDNVTLAKVLEVLPRFRGLIQQVPPMYSAIKHNGQRLYTLARQGIQVERDMREVCIYALDLVDCKLPEIELDIHCSKGTYVRVLVEDLGRVLDCGAYVIALRRTAIGQYAEKDVVNMSRLEELAAANDSSMLDTLLFPIDSALRGWPELQLSGDTLFYFTTGQAVLVPNAPSAGWVRVYSSDRRFIGTGQIQDDGRVAPRRLMAGN